MSTVVLCCNTLEDELQKVMAETGLDYPVLWLDAGLHNQPERLRDYLNQILRQRAGLTRALLAMGHCGGACAGLGPFEFELIIPRADDCLSILLGSMGRRQRASGKAATYFLTAGWLRHTENLITSFDRDREMFGQERAERIYRIMLKHYQRFGFIDTGTYDPAREEDRTRPLARLMGINLERLTGDLSWLGRLLTGPWDDDEAFIIVPPGETLSAAKWGWSREMVPQM